MISPESPRAIYFSPNAYVGYVPGGEIEIIIAGEVLGYEYLKPTECKHIDEILTQTLPGWSGS